MSFSLYDTLPKVGDSLGMEFYNKFKLRTRVTSKEFNNKLETSHLPIKFSLLAYLQKPEPFVQEISFTILGLVLVLAKVTHMVWMVLVPFAWTWTPRFITFQTRNLSMTLVVTTPELLCICIYIYSMKFDLLQDGVPYSFPFFEAYMFVKA